MTRTTNYVQACLECDGFMKWKTSSDTVVEGMYGVQTRSGPPVETAMSANQVSPGPLPGESMQHAPTAPSTLLRDAPPAVPSADAAEEDDGQEAAAESQPAPVAAQDVHLHAHRADQPGLPGHACQPGPLHNTIKAVAPPASPFEAMVRSHLVS